MMFENPEIFLKYLYPFLFALLPLTLGIVMHLDARKTEIEADQEWEADQQVESEPEPETAPKKRSDNKIKMRLRKRLKKELKIKNNLISLVSQSFEVLYSMFVNDVEFSKNDKQISILMKKLSKFYDKKGDIK